MTEIIGGLAFLPLPDRQPDNDSFFSEILTGWKRAQLARNFSDRTIARRLRSVMRFADFTGRYPWEWTPSMADEYVAHLRGVKNLSLSTARSYQSDIALFCAYASSSSYEWNANCERMYGTVMTQIITDLNRARHSQAADTGPEKRAFELDELQAFFDHADLEVERILRSHRKGSLAAWRDSVAFKVCYGWGLRHDELRNLRLVDFARNVKAPYFGDYGQVRVRHGKANRGAPKKQRTVLTLLDWAAEALADWVKHGLPRFGEPTDYLFPTATGGIVGQAELLKRFRSYTSELELPPGLDIHGLRRSYATHMITIHGYDEKFISLQLGHAHLSTTSIYTLPSADYAVHQLERVLGEDIAQSGAGLYLKPQRIARKVLK